MRKRITVPESFEIPVKTKEAALEYFARKEGRQGPDGFYSPHKRDGETRSFWFPSEQEECSCCKELARPAWDYPNTLQEHCCSIIHIAHLYEIPYYELRLAVEVYRYGGFRVESARTSLYQVYLLTAQVAYFLYFREKFPKLLSNVERVIVELL